MAAFTDYVTVEGERMLAKAVAGQNISFTKVAIGSGELASGANPRTMTALITQVKEIDVQSVTLNSSSSVLVSAYFTNRNITTGFYFREKGIYMSDGTNEVLGIYGNAGADADYIDTNASVVIERLIKSVIELTDQEMANIEVGDYIYEYSPVLADDVQTIADFVKTTDALAMKEGQRVIINNKKAYTYVGGNQREISNYITGTAAVRAGETIKTADPSGYNTIARRFAIEAESYAVGGTGTRENENIDNAKYYYNQIKNVSESISGALRPCGTIEFANLPDVTSEVEGNMYNISDEFVTTDQFKEGAGYTMPLGTNIYVTSDGFWDCLPGSPVTGVKGDKETEYRRGNVNITPENIGALPESEKDETEEGTMAYNIAKLNNNLTDRYLGLMVKTSIIQAFVIPASFLTGEATVSLTSIGLPECTTDDYNICIIFSNHVVNGNLVFLGQKISTNNKELIFQMPLNMDYSGEIWVTGIAVASHK